MNISELQLRRKIRKTILLQERNYTANKVLNFLDWMMDSPDLPRVTNTAKEEIESIASDWDFRDFSIAAQTYSFDELEEAYKSFIKSRKEAQDPDERKFLGLAIDAAWECLEAKWKQLEKFQQKQGNWGLYK